MPDIMCRNALMIFHDYILDLGSLIDLITELQFIKEKKNRFVFLLMI